jgi:transcriptional regulator with XRE-family HTH domain
MIDLGKINKELKHLGISQSELARKCKVEQSALSHFLSSGKQLKKDIKLIKKICSVINLNWQDIIK